MSNEEIQSLAFGMDAKRRKLPTTPTVTTYAQEMRKKEQKYKEKTKVRWIEELTPKEVSILKSSLTQAFCGTSYLIECVDNILAIQRVSKHYPLFEQMLNEIVTLNTDLYNISVHTEKDEENRVEFEKMIFEIVSTMPELNLKQLKLLQEFTTNLKFKK